MKFYPKVSFLFLFCMFFSVMPAQRNTSKRVACVYEGCPKTFTTKGNMKVHVNAVHLNIRPHQCSVCGKSFAKKQNMVAHKDSHEGKKPFACPSCGKRFSQKRNMKRHVQVVHKKTCKKRPKEEAANEPAPRESDLPVLESVCSLQLSQGLRHAPEEAGLVGDIWLALLARNPFWNIEDTAHVLGFTLDKDEKECLMFESPGDR